MFCYVVFNTKENLSIWVSGIFHTRSRRRADLNENKAF